MSVIDCNDSSTFSKEMKNAKEKLVVVDFHATWCGPCKQIAPFYKQLAGKYADKVVFLKVDVDQNKEVAMAAGVQAMPSFGFYHKGALLEPVMKGADPRRLEDKIKTLAEKHSRSAFSGSGFSLAGGSQPSASAAAPAKSAGAAAPRRNPWADPNFFPKSSGLQPKTSDSKQPTPAPSTSTPTPAQPQPSSSASSTPAQPPRQPPNNPWADPNFKPKEPTPVPAPAPAPQKQAAQANDSQLKVNPDLLQQLVAMGFPQVRAEKALLFTKNKSLDLAINWVLEHSEDIDIDEPLTVVSGPAPSSSSSAGSAPASESEAAPSAAAPDSGAADIDLDDPDLDEGMKNILRDAQKRKAAEAAARNKGSEHKDEAPKKKIADMSSEEKMQWLENKKEEARKKREEAKIQTAKDSEKNRQMATKAAAELAEKREEMLNKQLAAEKAREKREKEAAKRRIMEKIAADKERRRLEAQREREALEKAKSKQ